jgi:CheY-like chemotaxis protein
MAIASKAPLSRPVPAPRPIPAVLVVEDDPDVATSINDVVEERGYRAICVGNGREALSVLEEERPALMLVDLFMPIMNGAEFLKIVKRSPLLAAIPRVIMTAANDPMISVKEDVTVLYKPVDIDALDRLLQKYCEPHPALPS